MPAADVRVRVGDSWALLSVSGRELSHDVIEETSVVMSLEHLRDACAVSERGEVVLACLGECEEDRLAAWRDVPYLTESQTVQN